MSSELTLYLAHISGAEGSVIASRVKQLGAMANKHSREVYHKKASWTTSNCYSQIIRLFLRLSLLRGSQDLTKQVHSQDSLNTPTNTVSLGVRTE